MGRECVGSVGSVRVRECREGVWEGSVWECRKCEGEGVY